MGIVYEAVDQKLRRHVALKLLTETSLNNVDWLERFWLEARAASSLNHPGICTVYELNESSESPFIVMELLEGDSLEKLYRDRPMPYPRVVELGAQLADALDAAHRKGILHRDIKPANIFLTKSGQAKLLDFGLASSMNQSMAPPRPPALRPPCLRPPLRGLWLAQSLTCPPSRREAEPLDARSDLYSLGVVLYEMATGQHPYSGTTPAVIFDKILNQQPPAPRTLNGQLPVEFENVLNKILEKDPELRCQSAAELRADFKRLQRKVGRGGDAVALPSEPTSPHASDSGSTHPLSP